MNKHIFSKHQEGQVQVIAEIEKQINNNSLSFTTVAPTDDYENDERMALTSLHFPSDQLTQTITQKIITPLKEIAPEHYYYPSDSLHMTIKNIKVIHNPPRFSENDIAIAKTVFANTIPKHTAFRVYFYRLLVFPANIALIGTTDSELDNIYLDLSKNLTADGLTDDKVYTNHQFFFCNMTLMRFLKEPSVALNKKIQELSKTIAFEPYTVDSVSLITSNAVMKRKIIIDTWDLKPISEEIL